MHINYCLVVGAVLVGLSSIVGAALADPANDQSASSGIIVHPGQKVAFLGASISDYGWTNPKGYIRLTVNCLTANGVEIISIPAGVGGNTSADMLARLDRDVISKKPDWMTVDAGGNDVWHNSVQFDQYMVNMTAIVDKAQAAGIHVIVQTCTPITEDLNDDFNKKMVYYNQFLVYLAAQKHCVLADLNGDEVAIIKTKSGTDNILTLDGVHMNDRGNQVMAAGLLRAIGLTDAQISKTTPATP